MEKASAWRIKKASFHDIDYGANYILLHEAKQVGVQQLIYNSAFKAEEQPKLAYFRAHADFSEVLQATGNNYTILQPTALFSAFDDVVAMARKGQIGSLGSGDNKSNPFYEEDLAKLAVQCIGKPSSIVPVGGMRVYSRLELVQLACKAAGYTGAIRSLPFGVVHLLLPLLRPFSRNMYDKMAFLVAVPAEDCVAPAVGKMTLEEYFNLSPKLTA